nr:MAG TPA: hypothetical protein [Bacteriophage sp.]
MGLFSLYIEFLVRKYRMSVIRSILRLYAI